MLHELTNHVRASPLHAPPIRRRTLFDTSSSLLPLEAEVAPGDQTTSPRVVGYTAVSARVIHHLVRRGRLVR